MKRYLPVLGAGLLFAALFASPAKAEVNINVGIGIPPIVVSAPPAVVVIPGTYVYVAPDIEEDVFFYRGYWWRSHGKRWYRAGDFGGPWIYISIERMPRALVHLPPRYKERHSGLERMDHVHVKKHWKKWEAEKHWDRHESWKRHKKEHKEHRKEHRNNGKHGRD